MKHITTFLLLLFAALAGRANPCPPPFLVCPNPVSVPCGTPFSFTPPTAIDLCCGTNLPVTALSTTTNGICPQFVARVWLATDCRGQTSTCTQTVAIVDTVPPSFCPDVPAVNLVPNPGFEVNTACPSNFSGQIVLAPPWTGANGGSSDYFHPCAPNPALGVPNNSGGSQAAHGGLAYVGIHAAYTTVSVVPPEYREYIQAPLSAPLVAGHTYYVSFHVSLSDFAQKAVDNLGAYLSATPVSSASSNALLFTPQVRNPAGSFLTNKTNWTLIQGEFTAAGGEQYLTIGNFYSNAGTPTVPLAGTRDWAYYYIDDVQVSECCAARTVECSAPVLFEPPAATDACSGTNVTVTLLTGTVSGPPCARVHRLVWQAADLCSNTVTCTQSVTVVDTTPPVVTCASNKTVECGAAWTFDPPTALDACCGNQVTILPLLTTVSTNLCPREYTRTWRVTDCCSNSVTCSQTVTVADTTPPVLLCPTNITVTTCSNSAPVLFKVTATDACDTNVQIICAPPPGSLFLLGTNVVVCTATDDCGNTSTCSFPVVVLSGASFWQAFPRGIDDCYAWPSESAYRGFCLNAGPLLPSWKNFDDPAVNHRFGLTWNLPPGTYLEGGILARMKDYQCAGGPTDDTIHLGLIGCGSTPSWIWSRPLGPSGGDPGLQSNPWCHISGCNHAFALPLHALPKFPSGTADVIAHINATSPRRLDLLVQDDTRVDFASLRLRRCPPQLIVAGFELSLTNAQLVHGPGAWTLARDAGTSFSGTFEIGAADGVRLSFENLTFAGAANRVLRLNATSPGSVDEGELFRLRSFGTGLVRLELGPPPPGVTQVEVRTLSNGVVVASNTLPATAGVELARFPASATILQAGAGRRGNLFVVIGDDAGGTISHEARLLAASAVLDALPRLGTLGLAVDGFESITLGQLEVAMVEPTDGRHPDWPGKIDRNDWIVDPADGQHDDWFISASGDAVARTEHGQFALSALEAGNSAPMSFAASLRGSGSNEFRAMIQTSFGQFAPVPGNASLSFALTVRPAAGQQDDAFNVSFGTEQGFWAVRATRNHAPVPLRGVQLWNSNDVRIVAVPGPASVSVSALPPVYWPSTLWFVEADICHRFIWHGPVTVRIDGADYEATELRFLTGDVGNAAGTFKELRVETTGAEALVLSRLETGPIQYRLDPPELDGDDLTIRGNPLGAVIQSAHEAWGPWATAFSESGELRAKITNAPQMFYRIKGR